ncbi:PilN domain-containing protein [Desulfopila sp. IMCC35006]|uniref:PilN domain-containing protein n=1 Tax=Desulfopila sp. IMCC35006 TaxID=2569542 RepID=UPI0010AD7781|nr:PilN domain-containing protein [Desulfopila sp. IMCC35006]TKB27011.1 PilN domain-containing protein [Desulfopila sp. IMCC35006]
MLKINLLPVRQLKKRAKARKQLFGMFFLFLLVLAVLGITGALQANKISNYQADIASLQKEKDSYTPILQKIEKLKKERAELVRRTEIIHKLKTDSSLTVRVLDEVANRVDNQRMWLESLQQQTSSLRLSGVALDNQTIAQFMDNLKESPFVQDVTLASSSLKIVSGRNLKSFELNCIVGQPEKQAPAATDTK